MGYRLNLISTILNVERLMHNIVDYSRLIYLNIELRGFTGCTDY